MAKVTPAKRAGGKGLEKIPGAAGRAASLRKTSSKQLSGSRAMTRKSAAAAPRSRPELPKELLLRMHDLMVKSRVLEERLIKVYRAGDAYFWIGGPGEEAFGVPLGLLVSKGRGPDHDFLHLHYRCTPTLVALGMTMEDSLRLMMNRATDPSTGGRNFCNHYCFPQWNVLPVSSPIEVQYGMAVGTAIAQRRKNSKGVTIVTGGDAGTAEGDFASCLVWASRPGNELPIFITVQNNKWGISTHYDGQHGEKQIADRGKAFGIRTALIDGNDPIAAYLGIRAELEYIRKTGKPVLAEFRVSRLYGHSSASGANRETDICPIEQFERKIVDLKVITTEACKGVWKKYDDESRKAAETVRAEPMPGPESVWDHTYVGSENADWRKF